MTECLSITSNNRSVEKHKIFEVEDHYPITGFLAHENNYIFKNKSEKLLFHPSYILPHIIKHRKNVLLGGRCHF